MKNNIQKKLILAFAVVVILFSFFVSKIHAADKWFYQYWDSNHPEALHTEMGPFVSKPTCDTDRKKIDSSWAKGECYKLNDVKITSFSPASGKVGDKVTLVGQSFIGVTKINFGTAEAVIYPISYNTPTETTIRAEVPSGATTGAITVVTKLHGLATSTASFTINNPSDTKWWFRNVQKQPLGPYETLEACNVKLDDYKKALGTTSNYTATCFQETIYNIKHENDLKAGCEDGMDNNGDGLTDINDPNCHTDGNVSNPSSYNKELDEGSLYTFLAPLACDPSTPGCVKNADGIYELKNFNPSQKNALGTYLNILIKILIGFAAVLAVIMIVMGGIEYMTSELISSKEEGKKRITNALIGLVIALGAYVLLYTVNPSLLVIEPNPDTFTATNLQYIENFEVPGASTYDGRPIKVNFKSEAYPAAKFASEKSGSSKETRVETAFILAMFAQETGSGGNTGRCTYLNANIAPEQLDALKKLFPTTYTTINMSCSGGASTHGGAIGYTQFLPGTWLIYKDEATRILGHQPNPWNTADALMMTALFLKANGGAGSNSTNQENAACKYFGRCTQVVNCGGGVTGTYGQCIMGKKLTIQQQIDKGIADGTLTP